MHERIFIARHGQNEDNVNGILNGHRDLPLTNIGRQQARDLGTGIQDAGIRIDHVLTSPLIRAVETARIASSVLGLTTEPTILDDLIERNFGIMTGLPHSEIMPRCAPRVIETETITYFLDPEGAETFPQLVSRGHRVLEELEERKLSGNTLLVCHGDIGKMIYAAATNTPWEDVLRNFHFGNGDLIEFSNSDDAHVVKLPQHNP